MIKILLLAFLVFLSGCSQPENSSELIENDLTMPVYFNTDRRRSVENDIYYGYEDQITSTGDTTHYNIFVVDIASGAKDYLCSTPGCTHSDESCTSYYWFKPEHIMYNKNHLIISGFDSRDEDHSGLKVFVSDLNGENRRDLFKQQNGETLQGNFALSESSLYYECHRTAPDSLNTEKYIMRMDLATGETSDVYKLDDDEQMEGAYKDRIYIYKYGGIKKLYSITTDGKIKDKKPFELSSGSKIVFFNEYFVQATSSPLTLEVTNIDTGEKETYSTGIECPVESYNFQFVGEDVICFTARTNSDGKLLTPHLLNRETGEVFEAVLRCPSDPRYATDIIAQNADKYLVIYDYIDSTVIAPPTRPSMPQVPTQLTITETKYAIISKADYLAGKANFNVL